ncbi:MAG: LysR substrate-binding domain-containing protein [Sneathiellales bacterium]|nr:LysR substrate-binding domain-containing protein [Sneathiellales bacterium]
MKHAQFKAFHAVAEFGGIGSAARALGKTQPAISLQIQALEKQYQITLFARQGHKFSLTPAGALLHNLSRRYFQLEEEAESLLRSLERQQSGKIRITSDIPHRIFPLTEKFRNHYPDISLSLSIGDVEEMKESLQDHLVDFAITNSEIEIPFIEVREIGSEKLTVTVPRDHAHAKAKYMSPLQIRKEPVLLFSGDQHPGNVVLDALAAFKVPEENILTYDNRDLLQEAIAHNVGIGFLSKTEIEHDQRLTSVEISSCSFRRREYLAFHKQELYSSAASAFREFLEI